MSKVSIFIVGVILGAAAVALWRGPGASAAGKEEPRRWQYKVTAAFSRLEKELEKLGDEGWEMVLMDKDSCWFKKPK